MTGASSPSTYPEDRDRERITKSMNTCSKCSRKRHTDQLAVRMNNQGNWTISCDDCAKQHGHKTRKELLGNIKIPDLSEHSKKVFNPKNLKF